MSKLVTTSLFLLLILTACGKEDDTANGTKLANSCRLDSPIHVGTNDLKNGVHVGLVLNNLRFDKVPSDFETNPSSMSSVELSVFDILYSSRWTEMGAPTGFTGARLDLIGPGPRWSKGFANAYVGNFSLTRNDASENGKFLYSTVSQATKNGSDNEAATTSIQLVMNDAKIVAVQMTLPITKDGTYSGRNETLCLKSANVKTPYGKK